MAQLPADVTFGRVTGLLSAAVNDNEAAPDVDTNPDQLFITNAEIVATPSVPYVNYKGAETHRTIYLDKIIGRTNEFGVFVDSNGSAGLSLVASDNTVFDTVGFYWTITVRPPVSSYQTLEKSFPVLAGSTIHFNSVLQSPVAPPTTIDSALANAQWAAASAEAAKKSAAEAIDDRTPQTILTGVSGALNLSSYDRPWTVRARLSGAVTSITLPSPEHSDSYTLTLVVESLTHAVAWPTVRWADGLKPDSINTGVTMVNFFRVGGEWLGFLSGRNMINA